MHTCQPIVRYWPLAAHGQRQLWVECCHWLLPVFVFPECRNSLGNQRKACQGAAPLRSEKLCQGDWQILTRSLTMSTETSPPLPLLQHRAPS